MANVIKLLARIFQEKEWAEDFCSKGKFRMNTLNSFRNYIDEHANNIGDKLEGISTIYLDKNNIEITFSYGDASHNISDFNSLTISPTHILNQNVFCMYAPNIDSEAGVTMDQFRDRLSLQEEAEKLGDYMVVITNIGEFFKRFESEINRLGYFARGRLVEYADLTKQTVIDDDKVGFVKSTDYAHQKEFRVIVDTKRGVDDYIEVEIGSLSDITILINTCDFNNSFKVEIKK